MWLFPNRVSLANNTVSPRLKCCLLRREQLRMRQDKKKQQDFIGAFLHSSKTCLPKCCHGPANHDAVVLASKVIIKTTQPPRLWKVPPFLCDYTEVTSCGSSSSWSNKIHWRGIYFTSSSPKSTRHSLTSSWSASCPLSTYHFMGGWITNSLKHIKVLRPVDKQCLQSIRWSWSTEKGAFRYYEQNECTSFWIYGEWRQSK